MGSWSFIWIQFAKRRELGSVKAAISDLGFLERLYQTLPASGIGTRALETSLGSCFLAVLMNAMEVSIEGEGW